MAVDVLPCGHSSGAGRRRGARRQSSSGRRSCVASSDPRGCASARPSSRPVVTIARPMRGAQPETCRSRRDSSVSPRHLTETPLSAYASLGLARVALVRGEFDAARQTLEQVLGTTPQFGSALRLLAESYRKLGREAEAERFVYRAGRVPPYSPYADAVIDELARESRNSILLLRLASEANLAINAEWSEYLTRRASRVRSEQSGSRAQARASPSHGRAQ